MDDVLKAVCEKMIRRHPHVFADTEINSVEDVLSNWEAIKKREKANQDRKSLLDGIPKHLPALLRAEKIQSKAAKVGFDWNDISGTIAKLEEEIEEFKQAVAAANHGDMEAEIGDLFFSLVNVCRFLNINPERALNLTTNKFIRRFQYMEKQAALNNRELNTMSLAEMDQLWETAKKDS